jgi:hypothetical protein
MLKPFGFVRGNNGAEMHVLYRHDNGHIHKTDFIDRGGTFSWADADLTQMGVSLTLRKNHTLSQTILSDVRIAFINRPSRS